MRATLGLDWRLDSLSDSVHMAPPAAKLGCSKGCASFINWNGLLGDRIAFDSVKELYFQVAKGRLKREPVPTIRPLWQANDENFLKLTADRD